MSSKITFPDKPKSENVLERKEEYLGMSLEEKRKEYRCGNDFTTLSSISSWPDVPKKKIKKLTKKRDSEESSDYPEDEEMNRKVSLWMGDITSLEVDAIVNAANGSLLGGGGVDGAIHKGAGGDLVKECALLKGCVVGEAVLTGGYKLPAKYVIHTVGPRDRSEEKLKKCYENCFKRFDEKSLTSLAFCCIATGIYGYPNSEAARVAVACTRYYLQQLKQNDKERYGRIERIVFCIFLQKDRPFYRSNLLAHFPSPLPSNIEIAGNNNSISGDKISSSVDGANDDEYEDKDGTNDGDDEARDGGDDINSSDDKTGDDGVDDGSLNGERVKIDDNKKSSPSKEVKSSGDHSNNKP